MLCVPTTNSKGEVNGALQCINKLSPGIGELKKDGVTDPLKLYVPFTIGDSGNLISLGMKVGGEIEALQSSNSEDTMSELSYLEFSHFAAEAHLEADGLEQEYLHKMFHDTASEYEKQLRAKLPKGSIVENAEIVRFCSIACRVSGIAVSMLIS